MPNAAELPRSVRSNLWWRTLWLSLIVLLGLQLQDAWARQAPPYVWVFWVMPLLIVAPGIYRDKLRSVAWTSFVSLLYFLLVVTRVFAEPGSTRTVAELLVVIALFTSSMFYLRSRGRELRGLVETPNLED